MASITCRAQGTEKHTHFSVEAVRRHFQEETQPCTWLVERPYDDGTTWIGDCGALSWLTHDGDGFECEVGHSHVGEETRLREGWEYAEDEFDAAVILRGGRMPVPMGPNTIIDQAHAAQIAAQL